MLLLDGLFSAVAVRVGHAYAKYAKYADYANMRMRIRIENLIHIFHIQREKIPSEMEVAPPHKGFSQFSVLTKL